MKRLLTLLLALVSLPVSAQLGSNFHVETYLNRPGAVTYGWDRTGETVNTVYTIRRGGIIVRQSSPPAVNGNDGILFYGEQYDVTLQVDDGPESAPLRVSLPAPPIPPPSGEMLYVILNFPDQPHAPLPPDFEATVLRNVAWVNAQAAGRIVWTPTFLHYTTQEPYLNYTYAHWGLPDYANGDKVKAELIAQFDLKNRLGLRGVLIDVDGFGVAWPFNSGGPLWLEPGELYSDLPPDRPWSPWVNSWNFVHEMFHGYGMWHFGSTPIPDEIDHMQESQLGYTSAEVMGGGASPTYMSTLNMLTLGIRDPNQIVRIPAGGATVTLTHNANSTGTQGALIPLTAAGAAYMLDYYYPYVSIILRPTYGVRGFSFARVGFAMPGAPWSDPARDIHVEVLSQNTDSATVRITTPGVEPPPPPPPPLPVTVTITAPQDGAVVPRKSSTPLAAATNPAGVPVAWSATCGTIAGTFWRAPGAPHKTCVITASVSGGSASVTVRTQ